MKRNTVLKALVGAPLVLAGRPFLDQQLDLEWEAGHGGLDEQFRLV